MLVKLVGNQKKVDEYIKMIEENKVKFKDDQDMLEYLNSLNIKTFEDILTPLRSFDDYKDSPVGFYVGDLNSSDEVEFADMQLRKFKDFSDSYMFKKTRIPYRLQKKMGTKRANFFKQIGINKMITYGLCDNADQVINYYKPYRNILLNNKQRKFIVLMTPIFREDECERGGFRYHKWGEYIGNQNPQHEYLYDDKHIDMIFHYQILELVNMQQTEQI